MEREMIQVYQLTQKLLQCHVWWVSFICHVWVGQLHMMMSCVSGTALYDDVMCGWVSFI